MSDMETRRALAQRVETDLGRDEQETGLNFFATDDRYTVTTHVPTMVRSLLKHGEADIDWIYSTSSASVSGVVRDLSNVRADDVRVEAVQASLPLATLTIKGSPRTSNRTSGIVHTPEEVADVGEVFDA
jgi:hypothetical protein